MQTRERIQDFALNEVTITDAYFQNALAKEVAYLKQYDADRLVAGFREVRGLSMRAPKYPGWESTQIRGHILGHYLTAAAQAVASTGDKELEDKLCNIVEQLAQCQTESGYLSAFEEQLFDNVEQNKPCWVPWYTMDKILAGLVSCYRLTGNGTALQIADRLGDWVYQRTSGWSEETRNTVLAVEYGGMNEALYALYMVTGKERHAQAAHSFDEVTLFTPVRNGQDILNGKHANTTIPKFLGGLYRYMALDQNGSESFYLEAAEGFWDMVVGSHTYVTGGNSEWEHFGEPGILDAERTNCNCETCNTYNMLKLSRELFQITHKKKYADFYENTLLNAILSSQNPKTGMSMYFQPMATGYFKVYSTPFDSFWCCTGTGMENFTKLNDSLYFQAGDTLFVNQFISSVLDWKKQGIRLEQISHIPDTTMTRLFIRESAGKRSTLALRIPDWAAGECQVTVHTAQQPARVEKVQKDGFVYLTAEWQKGDEICYELPLAITAHPLHDNPHTIALKYGPLVLSAELGSEDMEESKTGVDVTIATRDLTIRDFITIPDAGVEEWIAGIAQNVRKTPDKLEFTLLGTDSGHLRFTPHYRQHTQRYGIYWNIVEPHSQALQKHILENKEKARRERVAIDSIPLGNDQYELLHHIQGENTQAGTHDGLQHRYARKDGWFSYEMKLQPGVKNYLLVKYLSSDAGRTFGIYLNEELYREEKLETVEKYGFYDKYYLLPESVTEGQDTVCVKFATIGDSIAGAVFDRLCIVTEYANHAALQACEVTGGRIRQYEQAADTAAGFDSSHTEYIIEADGEEISMRLTPADENGLVSVNGILIEDTQAITLSAKQTVEVAVTAENFEETRTYHFTIA